MSGLLDKLLGRKTEVETTTSKPEKKTSITMIDGYVQDIILLRYTSLEDGKLVTFVINMSVDEWNKFDDDQKAKYVANITLATIHNSTGLPGFGRYVGIDSTISHRRVNENE